MNSNQKGVRAMVFEDDAGLCPWHGRDTSFSTVWMQHMVSPHWPTGPGFNLPQDDEFVGLNVMRCMFCEKTVIVLDKTRSTTDEEQSLGAPNTLVSRTLVYPEQQPRSLDQAAPEEVRSLFAEASACESVRSLRAAGVMYRAVVEQIVKDQGATGRTLYDKIENLGGSLSSELIDDLHEARMLGNDSIHAGIQYSAEEVNDVAGLIEEAVLELYVQPEQKRAMREARKARRGKPTV